MIRVAAWSGVLFALGCAVCQLFPAPLVEPLVVIALGAALLLLAGRPEPRAGAEVQPRADGGVQTTRAAR